MSITAWEATAVDGSELTSVEFDTFEHVNRRGGARNLKVWIGEREPMHANCVPDNGESLHLYTRRGILNACTESAKAVNMPIIELRSNGKPVSRIYIHPEHGVVFSTMDLNL